MRLKNCKNCGKSVIYGRSDKVFCSTACRVAFHRKENAFAEEFFLNEDTFWQFFADYKKAMQDSLKIAEEFFKYIVLMKNHPKDDNYHHFVNETLILLKNMMKGTENLKEIFTDLVVCPDEVKNFIYELNNDNETDSDLETFF